MAPFWAPILLIAVTGYMLGNLNGAVLISSLFAKEDVRKHGSGNAGLTNYIRNYGASTGVLVILIDGLKAIVSCLVARLYCVRSCAFAPSMKPRTFSAIRLPSSLMLLLTLLMALDSSLT